MISRSHLPILGWMYEFQMMGSIFSPLESLDSFKDGFLFNSYKYSIERYVQYTDTILIGAPFMTNNLLHNILEKV